MKNPTIEISFSSQKKLYVSFDRNDNLKFPNKTIAKAYSFKLKKLIKETIISVSSIQSTIYNCYRSNYLYLPNNVSHHVLKNIQNFDFKIDFVFKEYSTGNGSFVFHSISYLINTLYASIMIFKEYANTYKVHYLKNEMNAMFNTLELIEKEFNKKRLDLDMCFTTKNRFKVIRIAKAI